MPLKFVEDAICLSGELGTKLKSKLIGDYYPFWWRITSGGEKRNYSNLTTIIEMNAATGKIYIEETQEFILGSAGHALELKCKNQSKTKNLSLILIEENDECFKKLQKNIKQICPNNLGTVSEKSEITSYGNIYTINKEIDAAIKIIDQIKNLGNSLFFFDPLLFVSWELIDKVAQKRLREPYKVGTEFIIFNFTSDWFLGRGDFHPLPKTMEKDLWNEKEEKTVELATKFFGNNNWKKDLLSNGEVKEREEIMIELYKQHLHKWFRYVLPLPFSPKKTQLYHLIFCSNYALGMQLVRNFYSTITKNPKYTPNNKKAYIIFNSKFPKLQKKKNERRPLEWKILWALIKNCGDGIIDKHCRILPKSTLKEREKAFDFLLENNYLLIYSNEKNLYNDEKKRDVNYIINWEKIDADFGIKPPEKLKPLNSLD
ncbi:MAG: three-Cys-motif partner protein TcmP [Promethearchaeota archaeon]